MPTSIIDRAKRAGCWAVALYAFAFFFALGGLVSLLNLDIVRALGGFILAALCIGGGIWLARRGVWGSRAPVNNQEKVAPPRRPRARRR